jgi:hypothetical protein
MHSSRCFVCTGSGPVVTSGSAVTQHNTSSLPRQCGQTIQTVTDRTSAVCAAAASDDADQPQLSRYARVRYRLAASLTQPSGAPVIRRVRYRLSATLSLTVTRRCALRIWRCALPSISSFTVTVATQRRCAPVAHRHDCTPSAVRPHSKQAAWTATSFTALPRPRVVRTVHHNIILRELQRSTAFPGANAQSWASTTTSS